MGGFSSIAQPLPPINTLIPEIDLISGTYEIFVLGEKSETGFKIYYLNLGHHLCHLVIRGWSARVLSLTVFTAIADRLAVLVKGMICEDKCL